MTTPQSLPSSCPRSCLNRENQHSLAVRLEVARRFLLQRLSLRKSRNHEMHAESSSVSWAMVAQLFGPLYPDRDPTEIHIARNTMNDSRVDTILDLARPGRMTDRSIECVRLAVQYADACGDSSVDSCHLLAGLFREGNGVAFHVLQQLDFDGSAFDDALTRRAFPYSREAIADDLTACMKAASAFSRRLNHSYCGTEHLLAGAITPGVQSGLLLAGLGIASASVEHELLGLLGHLPN